MKKEEALVTVQEVLTQIGIEGIATEDSNLNNDLGMDSLDAMEMITLLEGKCDIEIKDDEASKCNTVGDVVDLIVSKKS